MENLILDELEDEEPRKGIPVAAVHYVSRILICFGCLYTIISIFFYIPYLKSLDFPDLLLLLLLKVAMPVFCIFYNLVHAIMEIKRKLAIPKFGKTMIGISIAILAWYLLGGIYTLFSHIINENINMYTSFVTFIIFCEGVVFLQDIKYYKWLN